jgi:hypothetical protein
MVGDHSGTSLQPFRQRRDGFFIPSGGIARKPTQPIFCILDRGRRTMCSVRRGGIDSQDETHGRAIEKTTREAQNLAARKGAAGVRHIVDIAIAIGIARDG